MLTFLLSPASTGKGAPTNEDLAATRIDYSAASAQLAANSMVAISPEDKTAAEESQIPPKAALDLLITEGAAVDSTSATVDEPVVSTEDLSAAVAQPPKFVPASDKLNEPVGVNVLDITGTEGRAVGAAVAAVEAPVDDPAVETPTNDVMPDEQTLGVGGEEEQKAVEPEFEDYVNVQPMVDVVSCDMREADEETAPVKPAHDDRSLVEAEPMVTEAVVDTVDKAPVDVTKDEPSPDALASVVEGTMSILAW